MHADLLDIVDENDNVIGQATRNDVYTKGYSNRIVHIFVIHPETGHIYITRRGAEVTYRPLHLCSSAAGHVDAGEDYVTAAARELQEEIGLETELTFISKFTCKDVDNSPGTTRFISFFITHAKDGFAHNEREVDDGFFIAPEELKHILDSEEKLHPHLKPCFEEYCKFAGI